MRTVAEGVETEEQLALLREVGSDLVQGYLLGRPQAPETLWQGPLSQSEFHGDRRQRSRARA